MKRHWLLLAVLGMLWCAAQGRADIYEFDMILDGLQEVGPVATPGSGYGTATLDTDTDMLSWNIGYSGLIGTTTAAHFHGPAAVGVAAAPRVTLDHTANPMVGSTTISDAFQGELLDGLWYVNVHSTSFGGGEIRGQVLLVPEPASLVLLPAGMMFLLRRRARS